MDQLHIASVAAEPAEGILRVKFNRRVFDDETAQTLHRRHIGHDVARGSIPEQLWTMTNDLLNNMAALSITFRRGRILTIGLTTYVDRNTTGLIEATDYLLLALAQRVAGTPELPSLMDVNTALIDPDNPEKIGWNAARGQVLDMLCGRAQTALDAALQSYFVI